MTAATVRRTEPSTRSERIAFAARPQTTGRVRRLLDSRADIVGLGVGPGDLVVLGTASPIHAEVVSVSGPEATVLPFASLRGHKVGEAVHATGTQMQVRTGPQLMGRILNGLGEPIDGRGPIVGGELVSIHNDPPPALARPRVTQAMPVGVRTIDTLLGCGRGQRLAILAGSGVGKSSLLSMVTRGSDADATVLCLVGERGREVKEFIDNDLGVEGLARAVVVVATSDQPALIRRNAAYLATRVAESLRDEGMDVNLLMDSVTRFAVAQREIGLAAGEIPTSRGYPPSALGALPGLLERAGTAEHGSITGFYTVLVEGDDLHDPVGDTVRSITDGHISLSRELANAGHFPSIDLLRSSSRVAHAVTPDDRLALAAEARRVLAVHDRARDLIEVGAYVPGADAELDHAVALEPRLADFMRQGLHEQAPVEDSWQRLEAILGTTGTRPASSTDLGVGDAAPLLVGAGGARP